MQHSQPTVQVAQNPQVIPAYDKPKAELQKFLGKKNEKILTNCDEKMEEIRIKIKCHITLS